MMRHNSRTLVKRVAAALVSTAVLAGVAPMPAQAEPTQAAVTEAQIEEAAEQPWTAEDATGALTEVEPAAPVGTVEAPASQGSDKPEAPATPKPDKDDKLAEPELADEVSFTRVGTTPDGKDEYELEARVNLPFDEEENRAYPVEDLTFMRTSGDIDIEDVAEPTVDGEQLDDSAVSLFEYPSEEELVDVEAGAIPEDITGDLISVDTSDTEMARTATVTTRVFAERGAEAPVAWTLYRGAAPVNGSAPVNDKDKAPDGYARIVVQVAGDWLKGGKNNAPQVRGGIVTQDLRQDMVFNYSAGAGAELQLYEPYANKRPDPVQVNHAFDDNQKLTPVNEPWAKCTADANGQCTFEVPVGNKKHYWVGMTKASPGYKVIEELRIGGSGATNTPGNIRKYAFATPELQNRKTYYSGVHYNADGDTVNPAGFYGNRDNFFMSAVRAGGDGDSDTRPRWRDSIGAFMQVRDNPQLPASCGQVKVGFVVDVSGSMGEQGVKSVKHVLTAAVAGLADSDVQVGFASFGTDSPGSGNPRNILEPVSLKNGMPDSVTNYIKNLRPAGRGDTDWEEGLSQFQGKGYDIVYMITDGNPTRTQTPTDLGIYAGTGNGVDTLFKTVELPIGVANTMKAEGTRIVPVGIPSKWTYHPESLDVFMGAILGAAWLVIRSQTDSTLTRPSGTGRENELDLSKQNLQAISGFKQGDPKNFDPRVDDFVLQPDPVQLVKGIREAALDCAVTVERRFYEGNDPKFVPSPDTTRPTLEESKNWAFTFKAQPNGGKAEEKTVMPAPRSGSDNLVAQYTLNGRNDYTYIDVIEPKNGVPEGWVPINVASGKNAEGRCGTADQDGNIEDLPSAEGNPQTNDFRAKNIPLKGGCHYVVYYMKKTPPPPTPGTFNLQLNKVDAADNTTPLSGAVFDLVYIGEDGKTESVSPKTPQGAQPGQLNWQNLKYGRYALWEQKPADGGYLVLSHPVYFKVVQDGDQPKLFVLANQDDTTGVEVTKENADKILTFPIVHFAATGTGKNVEVAMKVANTKSGDLPKTGGEGVALQLLMGTLILIAGAFTARRRLTPATI